MNGITRQLMWFSLALGVGLAIEPQAAEVGESAGSGTVIGRLQLGGVDRLNDESGGRVFREIWNLPESVEMRREALDKIAATLANQFVRKEGQEESCARLIRPLLDDLFKAEVGIEALEHPENVLEATLAVRLDEAGIRNWQERWTELLAGWKPRAELQPGPISTLTTNSWFAVHAFLGVAADSDRAASTGSPFAKLREGQRPFAALDEPWAKLEADLAKWARRSGGRGAKLPHIDFTVSGRRENLRTEAVVRFQGALVPQVEKWEIPMDTVRDPLISFTAIQGFRPWLERQPWFLGFGLEKAPNQLFVWELSQTAFQVQAAVPVPDAKAAFDRLAERGMPKLNQILRDHAVGQVIRVPDRPELVWRDLPLVVPYLRIAQEKEASFLHGGLFPVPPSTNAAPPQLFEELRSQPDLLYYDWELTQAKLTQLRPLLQVAAMFLTVSPLSTNSAAAKWLDAVETRLGNTVTAVTRVSDQEVRWVRTSPLGMNSFELISLANWLEGTNFPRLNLQLDFQPIVRGSRKQPGR